MTRYRFLLYTITGLVFGVIDWLYLDWLAHFSWGKLGDSILVVPIILLMNFGIWLVPLIPVVIYESRRAQTWWSPAFAGILTWSCAIFSYYAYYAALLSTGRLPNLEHLNLFRDKDESFWAEYWEMFHRIITIQFLEWIVIAVIGGAAIGALSYLLFRRKPLVD